MASSSYASDGLWIVAIVGGVALAWQKKRNSSADRWRRDKEATRRHVMLAAIFSPLALTMALLNWKASSLMGESGNLAPSSRLLFQKSWTAPKHPENHVEQDHPLWNFYQNRATQGGANKGDKVASPAHALTIAFTSDVHGHIVRECHKDTCYPGAPHLASFLNTLRRATADGESLVVVDAGDAAFGSASYDEDAVAKTMNNLQYNAMTIGNHDLDIGPERLKKFAKSLDFPVLGSNVQGLPFVKGLFKISLPKDAGNLCLVGVTTDDSNPLAGPGVTLKDPIASAMDSVRKHKSDCQRTVLVSHAGIHVDRRMADIADVDVLIGGHSHVLTPILEEDRPELAEFGTVDAMTSASRRLRGRSVPIVHVGAHGRYAGLIRMEWTDGPASVRTEVVPLDERHGVGADGLFESWQKQNVQPASPVQRSDARLRANVDGRAKTLCGQDCRAGECLLGNLISDAMHAACTAPDGPCGAFGDGATATVSLLEAGTVRSCVSTDDVDLAELLPWPNHLTLLAAKGSLVKEMLEHGVRSTMDANGGALLHPSGLGYSYNSNGNVTSVWLPKPSAQKRSRQVRQGQDPYRRKEPEVKRSTGDFTLLDDHKKYAVVVTDWLASGGDGFGALVSRAERLVQIKVSLNQAVQDSLSSTPRLRLQRRFYQRAGSSSFRSGGAGFLGGLLAFLASYPIYTMFVRRSVSQSIQFSCRRLFGGLSTAAFAAAVLDGVYFSILESPWIAHLPTVLRSTCSACAAATAAAPLWVVVTQRQLMTKDDISLWSTVRSIYKRRGWIGFYVGLPLDLLMCSFPIVRQVLLQLVTEALHISAPEQIALAASGCSILATILTFPVQRWRVYLQSGGAGNPEGRLSFCRFSGLQFKLLDTCVKTFILFLVKEGLLASLEV